ncbi:MAG: right-handed parallel beta-helix repeat-containing protein, partial [Myxococcota bacterium]
MIRPIDVLILLSGSCLGDQSTDDSGTAPTDTVLGDGCEEAPPGIPGSLTEALADGSVVELGWGTFRLTAEEASGLTGAQIVATCPARTILEVEQTTLAEGEVALAGLTLRPLGDLGLADTTLRLVDGAIDASQGGIRLETGRVQLERVRVRKTAGVGLTVEGGEATITRSRITSEGLGAVGVVVRGGRVSIADSELVGLSGAAVEVRGGGFGAERTTFAQTGGLRVLGGESTLLEAEIRGTRRTTGFGAGLFVSAGSLIVDGTTIQDGLGPGAVVTNDGSLSLSEVRVSGHTFAGVWVADATASLTDVDVDGNGADPDLGGGVGVGAVAERGNTAISWVRGRATGHPVAPVYVSGGG